MTRLRVIQHNVLAWDRRKYDLSNTYRQLDPDIILINSHGLKNDTKLKIPGYRLYQSNLSNEQMDGVAIAIKTKIPHKIDDDFLSETLATSVETDDGPLTIATTYLPPRRPYIPHPDFLRLLRRQSPVFIAGDLNARHPTFGTTTTNQVGRDLLAYLRHQTARHIGPHFSTYYGPVSTTSPDIVLTNSSNFLHYTITPGPLTTSDHIPIILDISTSPILTPSQPFQAFHRTDWDAFKLDEDLDMSDQPDLSQATLEEIDAALNTWMTTIKTTAERHIPRMTYRLEPHPRPSRATQIARVQFKALKDRATLVGWTLDDYRRYIQLRQTLQNSRRNEARNHWGQTLDNMTAKYTNPRAFWKRLKILSGHTKGPDSYLIDNNGQKAITDNEKERLFTPIWETVFKDEVDDNDIDNVLQYITENLHRTTPYNTADLARLEGTTPLNCRVTLQEVTRAIGKKATCPGSSGINRTIIYHLPLPAMKRLRDILNSTLSAGYFPDLFKEAEMRMIPKPGKVPTLPDSYRPISLLEVPGKVFERVITHRLRDHLEGEGGYSEGQYGFRRSRGTIHAIAMATETLAVHHASRHRCNLVLRDVSKAFDKVWHLGLKYKILHLGLPAPVERLLCDFLEDRTARIKVGKHRGPAFPLETGVPQGSVLSPTLYALYTSDCPDSHAGVNIQYADDVTQIVFHQGRSSQMLNRRTGREIERVSAFEGEWKIKTNLAKFTVIPTATKRPAELLVADELVDFRPQGTMLGLKVSSRGYTTHITARVGQAKTALARLYRFRDLDSKIKLHLIKALILPILTYPPIPLHTMSRTAISRLQKVQNAALRFVYNTRWDQFTTSEALHEAASLPALNVRLHRLATKVWEGLEEEGGEQFLALQQLHRQAPQRNHSWFPRSLPILDSNQEPAPRYL